MDNNSLSTIKEEKSNIPHNPYDLTLYDIAYLKFSEVARSKQFGVGDILVLIGVTTQIVQGLRTAKKDPLDKPAKKALVVRLITQWIDDAQHLNEQDKFYLKHVFVPTMLDGAIDSLCELEVNKIVKSKCDKFLSCLYH